MEEYLLDRTGQARLGFIGERLAEACSPGKRRSVVDPTAKSHWFEMDAYRTEGGNYILHIRYRFSGALYREAPYDQVTVHADSASMLLEADDWDPMKYVKGFPSSPFWADKQLGLERDLDNDFSLMVEDVSCQLLRLAPAERVE